jgi:hypothetical protein
VDWRCVRTCAAVGRRDDAAANAGGGSRFSRAVRIAVWARWNRVQTRLMVRSLRVDCVARMAAAMLLATARFRNVHTVRVVRLSRRILWTIQTLMVRPQPHRRWRLLQKIRRARTVRRGLLSSKPVSTPCRMSVPTVRQCGHGVGLSRSTIAAHSASSR